MTNQFNLQDLFASIWGYKPTPFTITDPDGSHNIASTPGGNISIPNSDLINRKTKAGKYGTYYKKDAMGRDVFMPVTIGGLFLPYAWVSIMGGKRIVETAMTERRGEVNEQIAIEDYRIIIKGFVIGHDGSFPAHPDKSYKKNNNSFQNSFLGKFNQRSHWLLILIAIGTLQGVCLPLDRVWRVILIPPSAVIPYC